MPPLRIAVVAPLVAPLLPAQPYGNHVFVVDLARGLAARGHDVTVYAAEGSRAPGVRVAAVRDCAAIRDAFVLLGREAAARRAMLRAFDEVARAVARSGADVISAHAFDAEAIERLEGAPVLHTLHLPPIAPAVTEAARRSRAAFATVSHACARTWKDAGLASVRALPNGVPPLPRAAEPSRAPEPVALVAGRISPEKGTDAAIRVAREAGLAPRLVGEVYDTAYFHRAVAPLLRPGELVPAIRREALRRSMVDVAVTMMPVAWDEPFGLVAAEAQLAGCPVVGYRRGALPEIVAHGVTGFLVDPGDEAALAGAARAARALDRRAIRAHATSRFSMDACLDGYEKELAACASR